MKKLRLILAAGLLAAAFSACKGPAGDAPKQAKENPPARTRAAAVSPPEANFGFEIQGAPVFVDRTREALTLLEGSTTFTQVERYISVIKEAEHSGMRAYGDRPVYEVGFRTWNYSAPWYAGTIAHDGYHSLLYHEAKGADTAEPPATSWTGADAERKCLDFQARVLSEIKADPALIKYVRGQAVNPTYQDIEYNKRNW